jgi:hypothetical protein
LLNTNTEFSIEAEESSSDALIIQASSDPPFDSFTNIMNFSTGELVMYSNFKNEDISLRSTQWFVCCLILVSLLAGAKYSCISPRGGRGSSADYSNFKNEDISLRSGLNATEVISPRGGRGSSADIKGIFGFKCRRILQANSGAWQQTLTIHPNSNRGTENNNQNNFDANGNLLHHNPKHIRLSDKQIRLQIIPIL